MDVDLFLDCLALLPWLWILLSAIATTVVNITVIVVAMLVFALEERLRWRNSY